MGTHNSVLTTCEVEKDRKNSSERHHPLNMVNVLNRNTTDESCLMRNTLLEQDKHLDPPISHSVEPDTTESKSNLETNCSRTNKKRKRKKKNKKMKRPKNGDAPIDFQGDTYIAKDNSIGTNSCHDFTVDDNAKTVLQIPPLPVLSRSQKKKKRKKQKLNASAMTDEALLSLTVVGQASSDPNEVHSVQLSYNGVEIVQAGENATSAMIVENVLAKRISSDCSNVDFECPDSKDTIEIKNDAGVDGHIEEHNVQQVSCPLVGAHVGCADKKRKRKRKKQKLNTSVTIEEAQVSLAVAGQASSDPNEVHSVQLSDNEVERVQAGENAASAKIVENVLAKRNSFDFLNVDFACLESKDIIEIKKDADLDGLIEEHSVQQVSCPMAGAHVGCGDEKRERKKQKLNTSAITEEAHVSLTVAGQASSDPNEVHSVELSDNGVERVQAGENAASAKVVENVLAKKTSSNCSNVDFACLESKDIIEIKKDTGSDGLVEEHNLQPVSRPLVRAHVGCADKKLLILDVNGLLADIVPYCHHSYKADIIISRKSVFKRPFCDDFLQFCFEKFNVGIWSSRTKKNMEQVIDFLMGESRQKLLFCWHQSHCTRTGFTTVENNDKPLVLKELKKLWHKLEPGLPWNEGEYNESNTLLLDDSPYKALRNPANTGIFPHSYQYKDAGDSSLGPGGDLRIYLERLSEAQNVQEFVAQNPFGQRPITESNPSWGFYQRILSVESCQYQEVASSSGPSGTGIV